jgi:outer membrane autotransporter protein
LQARFNANAFSGRVEGGYRFVAPVIGGGIGITPYAAAQFTTLDLPAYAEQALVGVNNFALADGSQSATDARSELGIRTDKSYAMQDAVLTLRGRLAWAHDYDPNRSIAATFQTLPGASFVVRGAAQASDSALTTASAELKWTKRLVRRRHLRRRVLQRHPLLRRQRRGAVCLLRGFCGSASSVLAGSTEWLYESRKWHSCNLRGLVL